MIPARVNNNGRISLLSFVALVLMLTLFLTPTALKAAGPSGSGGGGKSTEVTFEIIPGSSAKRIILSAKAAERLGIKTGKVSEASITLRQMVSGLLVPPVTKPPEMKPAGGVFGGFQKIDAVSSMTTTSKQTMLSLNADVWVLVTLSRAEWERLAKDKPARLFPLDTRGSLKKEIWAHPTGMPPLDDMKRAMMRVYYVLPGKDHGLEPNHRMRVELQLSGSDEKHKVVPYSAIYYDGEGSIWVYVNTKPLVFERQRVGVERVINNLAVLSQGPPVGTSVVTVGAAMLWGTEIFGK